MFRLRYPLMSSRWLMRNKTWEQASNKEAWNKMLIAAFDQDNLVKAQANIKEWKSKAAFQGMPWED